MFRDNEAILRQRGLSGDLQVRTEIKKRDRSRGSVKARRCLIYLQGAREREVDLAAGRIRRADRRTLVKR